MTISAALLLLLASQDPSASDLVRTFLDGGDAESARARQSLVALGHPAIPALVSARKAGLRRAGALDDLLFDLKSSASGDSGRPYFDLLRSQKVSVDMQQAPAAAVLDYFREIATINLLLDPGYDGAPAEVTVTLTDVPLRKAIEGLCEKAGLDYDVRCGVLLLARPERLWAAGKEVPKTPLTDEETKRARAGIAELGSDSPKARDQATAELRKLGPETVPLLREAARHPDPETAGRARALIAELTPRPGRWIRLPDRAAWREQKLGAADFELARALDVKKLDLAFEGTKPDDILAFIRDFTGLKIEWKTKVSEKELTVKVRDLPLGRALELILLPLGFDLRIEKGVLEIVDRR